MSLVARVDSDQRARAGEPLAFTVRADRMCFFDPVDGRALDAAAPSMHTDERSGVVSNR
jgi:hypothetical protein